MSPSPPSNPRSGATRRAFLGSVATGGLLGTAGCLQTLGFRRESAWRDPPLAEDRPDAVYVPAMTEGMGMYGKTTAGRYGVALTYSYPHRFWTLSGTDTSKTVVEADDDVHLMVSLWDTETGQALPVDSGLDVEIRNDEGLVTQEVAYPMLSQQMGMHYGDNYALDGEGAYEAHVRVGGVSVRRTGGFAGAFESAATATFDVEFDADELRKVSISRPENAGERGAVPPMEMGEIPVGRAPAVESLPGRHLGRAGAEQRSADSRTASGDAVFDAFLVGEDTSDGDSTDQRFGASPYLYVSVRTPHNEITLPMMGLRATLSRDGEPIFEETLRSTLDPELGYHYGAVAPAPHVRKGDQLRVKTTTTPQIARHDGYETAFFETGDVSIDVS
ncbi:DUF7350 domain-containing protein [Halobellus sp. GM3]|uniref:DUF7350 domain-containing protein n=1 Tax=Halobellus sp. GM3 TaxID=3458410 RepID=UPI00403D8EB4